LEDVLLRILRIEEMILIIGNADQLAANQMYKDAMERNFEVVGEAIFHIRKLRPELALTHRDKIIALRHIIVHDYYEVDPAQLWVVATEHLPLLKKEIQFFIDEENKRLFGTIYPDLDI
jgi:uncharacterized protein with HEPN domain